MKMELGCLNLNLKKVYLFIYVFIFIIHEYVSFIEKHLLEILNSWIFYITKISIKARTLLINCAKMCGSILPSLRKTPVKFLGTVFSVTVTMDNEVNLILLILEMNVTSRVLQDF